MPAAPYTGMHVNVYVDQRTLQNPVQFVCMTSL